VAATSPAQTKVLVLQVFDTIESWRELSDGEIEIGAH
jgi:hypothetical protein